MRCRLCTSEDAAAMFEVRGSRIDRCKTCGFVQVRDRPTEEELTAIYSNGYFQKSKYADRFAQEKEANKRLSLLSSLGLSRSSRVLDAGCATGDFIVAAREHFEMWGIDISAYATEEARRACPEAAARIFTGLIEDQKFEHGSFDAIVLWDVVEHLWDPVDALKKLILYLRPGGHLVMSTPNIGAVIAKLMGARWAFMTPPEHLGFFSDQTMERLLRTNLGMEPVKAFSTGKWVNVGFLAYKLRRVFPQIPELVVRGVQASPLGRAAVYVPTVDIQYAVARKT